MPHGLVCYEYFALIGPVKETAEITDIESDSSESSASQISSFSDGEDMAQSSDIVLSETDQPPLVMATLDSPIEDFSDLDTD